jgi:hypothetical protein
MDFDSSIELDVLALSALLKDVDAFHVSPVWEANILIFHHLLFWVSTSVFAFL